MWSRLNSKGLPRGGFLNSLQRSLNHRRRILGSEPPDILSSGPKTLSWTTSIHDVHPIFCASFRTLRGMNLHDYHLQRTQNTRYPCGPEFLLSDSFHTSAPEIFARSARHNTRHRKLGLHFAPLRSKRWDLNLRQHQRTTCELGNVGDTTNDAKHNFQTREQSTSRAVTASIMTNLMDARCKSPRNAGTHCIRNAQVRNSSSRSTLSKNDRNRPGYCSGCQPKNWNLHFVAVSSKKCNLRQNHFGETIELLVVHTRKQR